MSYKHDVAYIITWSVCLGLIVAAVSITIMTSFL